MRIDIITLFPEMFRGPFEASIIARAVAQGVVQIELHDLRAWGEGRHRVVDDSPYGGGAGAQLPRLILLCGHYEGVDERVREHLANDEISVGDYVLSGGELAAMVLVDAVVRGLPGALGSDQSLAEESHSQALLEYPQYTRPAGFRGWQVPEILLSGHHEEVRRWRRRQRLLRTARRRPDLLAQACLNGDERRWLEEELETKLGGG